MTSIYASKTRLGAVAGVALCAASCLASCARRPKSAPPEHGPPPAVIVVRHEHLALRAAAALELHAMLATAARNDVTLAPEFEPGRVAYVRAMENDDDDRALRATFRELHVGPLAPSFAAEWEKRSKVTWAAIDRAHAAIDDQAEGVLVTLAKDLGVTWHDVAIVDVVAESPPAGRTALLTPLLAAKGPCFAGGANTSENNARIIDCVVVRALLSGEHSPELGDRFFTVLVVHAVAAVMTGIEPKHQSVDRRAVAAVEPTLLAFLTAEWHGGPVRPDLERRYRERANAPGAPASR